MYKVFNEIVGAAVTNGNTYVIPPETMDAGLNPPENTVIPTADSMTLAYKFKDGGPHRIIQGTNRFKEGSDFTTVCNGQGQLTITWTNAGTPLSAGAALMAFALVDSITE